MLLSSWRASVAVHRLWPTKTRAPVREFSVTAALLILKSIQGPGGHGQPAGAEAALTLAHKRICTRLLIHRAQLPSKAR